MHTGTKYPYMHILFINLYFTTAEPQFQEDNTTTSKDINYEKLLWSSWGQAIAFPDFFETRITFPGGSCCTLWSNVQLNLITSELKISVPN